MRLDVISLVPEAFAPLHGLGVIGRALRAGIAEVLKRMRGSLLTTRPGDVLRNTLPIAVAPRRVHVRVAEPIAVHTVRASCAPGDETQARAALLATHHERLQRTLDALGDELADETRRHAMPNALWSGGATR